ncbi:Uma2 family endonuclease [Chryseolinea lacunae]|uniref:Uma2 family endonuclease n=1 Tax=Chryseolinea lacunae TaxID=2801331 RepID=A0ABS1KV59_9BACT|nr:Uma2 family endonuclease [Chryseolinea lacunae]MBL0743336.1 Uma2 family endonuclease [Chryseolinea lacunae]
MKTSQTNHTKGWTADNFLLLEETNTPCELINGEIIMSPSPLLLHQLVSGNLYDVLKIEARRTGGRAIYSPIDFHIDNRNVFQPDLIFVRKENLHALSLRGVTGVPDLVVEIMSPPNAHIDKNFKKKTYLDIGISEYWIVDPVRRVLEIFTPQSGPAQPKFRLVERGEISSTILSHLKLRFEDLFIDTEIE